MRGEQDMPAVNFLIKPASGMCNLRCKYCFYDDIGDNRSVKNMGMMQPETARLLIAEGYRLAGKNGAVRFTFQGGEPTLAGLPFLRDSSGRPGTPVPKG